MCLLLCTAREAPRLGHDVRPQRFDAGAPTTVLELLEQPGSLTRRKIVLPSANDTLADERRHIVGTATRPALLILAHALEATVPQNSTQYGLIGDIVRAHELPDATYGRRRVGAHAFVRQEEHIVIVGVLVPRTQIVEIIAEVDLAGQKTFEKIRP